MSCIDAAIIKALVEHIGMNPDDITTGGTSSSSIIPATWSYKSVGDGNSAIAFTLPEGYEIKLGTCLKLKGKNYENWAKDSVLFCYEISSSGNQVRFRNPKVSTTFTLNNGVYVSSNCYIDIHVERMPDNETTGLFTATSTAIIEDAIHWIIYRIGAVESLIHEHHG